MKITIEHIKENPVNLMRGAGYSFQRKEGEESSFIRSFAQSGFPRFHIYARVSGSNLELSIHLDQKKETYGQDTRHHGEYGNDGILKEEIKRLRSIFK